MNSSINELSREETSAYLKLLGFDPSKSMNLSPADLKKAYKKKALATHPDRNEGKEEDFLEVSHAYNMLTNPKYRSKNNKQKKINLDIDIKVPCTFEDAFFGNSVIISMNKIKMNNPDIWDVEVDEDGNTKVEAITLKIDLPVGCVNGHQEVKTGYGIECGGKKGDLRINVIPNRKHNVQVHNLDVLAPMPIPLKTLLKGGKIEILTMYGVRPLWVPPGTQPGAHLCIRNCGVDKRGDHIVVVQPIFPTPIELHENEWSPLNINWKEHQQEVERQREEEKETFDKFMGLKFGKGE